MTTSSDPKTPIAPAPNGEHWFELTATLCPDSTDRFGDWLSGELTALERDLDRFATPNSLRKSLRR